MVVVTLVVHHQGCAVGKGVDEPIHTAVVTIQQADKPGFLCRNHPVPYLILRLTLVGQHQVQAMHPTLQYLYRYLRRLIDLPRPGINHTADAGELELAHLHEFGHVCIHLTIHRVNVDVPSLMADLQEPMRAEPQSVPLSQYHQGIVLLIYHT